MLGRVACWTAPTAIGRSRCGAARWRSGSPSSRRPRRSRRWSARSRSSCSTPRWTLARGWRTWWRRGRPRLRREVLPYVAVVISTAVAATALSGVADGWVRGLDAPRSLQVALVAMAYLLPFGVVFLLKFALFERVVFSDPPLRSRTSGSRVGTGER